MGIDPFTGGGQTENIRILAHRRLAMALVFRVRAALLLAAALASATTVAGVYRVTCKGIHKLSTTATGDYCTESAMLNDADGRFLPSLSEAHADLGRGVLIATAGGGAIRDVGYEGREATSVIIEQLRMSGSWTGEMPVEVTMSLHYRFEGEGESRLGVMLGSSTSGAVRAEHRAAAWIHHTGLGGAVVLAGRTRGRFEQPPDGSIASRTAVEFKVIQRVDAATPDVKIRADLIAYALPNLGLFEESLASLVHAHGEIALSAPCPIRIEGPSHIVAWDTTSPDRGAGGRGFQC